MSRGGSLEEAERRSGGDPDSAYERSRGGLEEVCRSRGGL